MLSHYLLTLYRSLTRHRLYSALNVLGLAVGIAVFLMLLLDVQFETGFEKWIPRSQDIYAVRTVFKGSLGSLGDNNASMGGLLEELRGDYPKLIGTRIWNQGATLGRGAQVSSEDVALVDTSFFKVFDLPLIEGNKSDAFVSPDSLVLTKSKAQQYFGQTNVVGRRLTIVLAGKPETFRVTGVLRDPPLSTDLHLDFLAPLTPQRMAGEDRWRHWGSEELQTFVLFSSPDQAASLNADMDRFVDRHGSADLTPPPAHAHMTLELKRLTALHLLKPKDAAIVETLGAVGLLTLVLAAVNYVNLATARAGMRAREVALRKVMGATPPALVAQFMAEAVFTAFLSALIGVALCELALPLVNAAGGLSLHLEYARLDGPLTWALAAALAVGMGSGIYPASVLARFRPARVLASARTPGGGRNEGLIREGLVVFQFAIAIAFTIATCGIVSQMHYLRTADLGFHRNGLIIVNSFDDSEVTASQRASLLQAWKTSPAIIADTSGTTSPGNQDSTNGTNFLRPGMIGEGPTLQYVTVSPSFFDTYGAHLIAGRLLDPGHGGDDAPISPRPGQPKLSANDTPVRNVVVNESVLHTMGFKNARDALGKSLLEEGNSGGFYRKNIIGVIRDLHFLSPHDPVPPMLYEMMTGDFDSAIAGVRYANADPKVVLAQLKNDWLRVVPNTPFRAHTINDNLARYYKPDDQHGRLFTIGALLAVLIGCVGLYGLASFSTTRRTKEIGIRKTLGASTGDILKLLINQFLRPVLIANLIAWPLAYLAISNWLAGFDQRIALTPLYFFSATIIALVIATLTVAGQAWRVAKAEPAKALRHE